MKVLTLETAHRSAVIILQKSPTHEFLFEGLIKVLGSETLPAVCPAASDRLEFKHRCFSIFSSRTPGASVAV